MLDPLFIAADYHLHHLIVQKKFHFAHFCLVLIYVHKILYAVSKVKRCYVFAEFSPFDVGKVREVLHHCAHYLNGGIGRLLALVKLHE